MKKTKIIVSLLAIVLCLAIVFGCVACTPDNPPDDNNDPTTNPLAGSYDIKVWVSEIEGVTALTQQQIDAFEAANPGIVINAELNGVKEGDAATMIIEDVASAPDLFCFAQDQLARLVQAGALTKIVGDNKAQIANMNSESAVKAGQVAGEQYAFPLTADNGYFLYYDKSVLTDDDVKTLEGIIAKCEANNKFFNFELEGSAWYTASFFMATGCHSNWTTRKDGEFVSFDDDWNSDKGVIALKGMQKLLKSKCYQNDSSAFDGTAAIVTGSWNSGAAVTAYGDNLGATKLPTFTVDDQTYQLSSFTGNKLMGIKPQDNAKMSAVLQKLALYLTGDVCQQQRFEQFGWGPSNNTVAESDAVKNDVTLSAFAAQAEFGTPQGNIWGGWWDIAKVVATGAKEATDDAGLQAVLTTYYNAIKSIMDLTPEQRKAYTVIGNVGGSSWDTDFEMVESPDGTWTSKDTFTLDTTSEFKVRQGFSWTVAWGDNDSNADTSVGTGNKSNYKVTTPGTYKIQLVVAADGKTAVINLVPAE